MGNREKFSPHNTRRRISKIIACPLLMAAFLAAPGLLPPAGAQEPVAPLSPGEAFSTRFSGALTVPGPDGKDYTIIDISGVSGSAIDLRNPLTAPSGQHWRNEPQRMEVTARQVGQVFGVAIDNAAKPTVYLAATSAYGLHLKPDGSDWMPGMWGENGGPGTIYRLSPDDNYQPRAFAVIAPNDRVNSGAGLGNIAYDRTNGQLFVSDLETGLIHRVSAASGADLENFDHGVSGRSSFLDVQNGAAASLDQIAFDPDSRPNYTECPGGDFTKDPACWNVADFRRRVWGLAVHRDPASGAVRLYYAVWGSQSFGNPAWDGAGDDQRNSVWSVGINADGSFNHADVRREFLIPGFFASLEDFQRAGGSNPVSDIAISDDGVMLLAERGGLRNLGLGEDEAFATPRESRVLRYARNEDGIWVPAGRYDIGFYDRKDEGQPFLRANGGGGVDFGFGYKDDWRLDPAQPSGFVWMSGDGLCSPQGPCFNPDTNAQDDSDNVTGLQGQSSEVAGDVAPDAAFQPYPDPGPATPPAGPDIAYMIDLDHNLDDAGAFIPEEREANDATTAGDVEVFKPSGAGAPPAHQPPGSVHLPVGSRPAHQPAGSFLHLPIGSHVHQPAGSIHLPIGSKVHLPIGSIHLPVGSFVHVPPGSIHLPVGSFVHVPPGSVHLPVGSKVHLPIGSKVHLPVGSKVHLPVGSKVHLPIGSKVHVPPGSVHLPVGSKVHLPIGSKVHTPPGSKVHLPVGSKIHLPLGSKVHTPPGSVHTPPGSKIHLPLGSKVHTPPGSVHTPPGSKVHLPLGSKVHTPPGSKVHTPPGSKVHTPPGSKIHLPLGSAVKIVPRTHQPPGSTVHSPADSTVKPPAIQKVPPGGIVIQPNQLQTR